MNQVGEHVLYRSISGEFYEARVAGRRPCGLRLDLDVMINGKVALQLTNIQCDITGLERGSWMPAKLAMPPKLPKGTKT